MKKQELEAILGSGGETPDTGRIEDHLHLLATEQRLPSLSIAICTARIEESGPLLQAALGRAADAGVRTEDEATLVFRGLHILGGARYPEAFQPLLRLLRRPSEDVDELLGDSVTETLAKIAAGAFDGDADALFAAITDGALDEFIRGALLDAATFLAWEGRIDRGRMARFLAHFHEVPSAADGDYAWVAWQRAVALLGLRELAPLVEAARREGRIPEGIVERADFEAMLADTERSPDDIHRFERAGLGYIEDVLETLESNDIAFARYVADSFGPDLDPESYEDLLAPAVSPVVNPWRHVGRNDPCPCGSGKKAKKCCLSG